VKKVLIYGNRKQDDMCWDVSTPELRSRAFLELFKYLKECWSVYECDYWGSSPKEKATQKNLFKEACEGNPQSAEKLLTQRQSYEYESFKIINTEGN
jgi:hypothetical protein